MKTKTLLCIFGCGLLAALILLAAEVCVFVRALTATVKTVPEEITQTRKEVLAEVDKQADKLQGQVANVRRDAFREIGKIRMDTVKVAYEALAEVDAVRVNANQQLAVANGTISRGVGSFGDISNHADALLDAYAVMPAQLAAEFAPSWESLQPEITCRQANGTGYGGCWHSRITALMGEGANVGGVFTKKFPAMADSLTGIAGDTRRFADKYVDPHPQTFKQKIWTGFKLVFGGAEAAARGGLLDSQVAIPRQ